MLSEMQGYVPMNHLWLENRGAVLDYLTWRHSCSCVSDDLPSDGYDRNNVQRLGSRLICLCEMREEVLVCSGLSSVWFNNEYDSCFAFYAKMSIYDFVTLPSWSDSKIVEEFHHLSLPLLEHVPLHTIVPAMEGAIIPLPTPDAIAASLPDSRPAKKSKGPSLVSRPSKKRKLQKELQKLVLVLWSWIRPKVWTKLTWPIYVLKNEDRLDRDEDVPMRVVSTPTPRLCKRLGAPPSAVVVSGSEPSYAGTSAPSSTSGRSLSLGVACGFLSVVVSGRVGKSGTEVIQRQMDPLDCLVRSALARDAEYDQIPNEDFSTATWKALDRTITPAELRRTESLLPLELSNHVNVLSAILVSHGYELNSRYTNLVSSRARLKEKLDQNKGDGKLLRSEVTSLDDKLEKLQGDYDTLGRNNRELCFQRDVASEENELALEKFKSQGCKDAMDCLKEEFEAAVQKVSNFHVGAKADFDKALVDFPITPLLRTELMTPDLARPSTHQLLWTTGEDSKPDMSFDKHSCSCVSDDHPSDGYDRNDVQRLCACLICLREMREEVLVRSRLSSVWFNKECDPVFRRIDDNGEMSIYDFMTLPSWSDAKIVEESHHLSLPMLERVLLRTTVPATEGAIISLPTPDKITASLRDSRLANKSKGPSLAKGVDEADLANLCAKIEDSLERDEGVPTRAILSPTPHLGKRLGAPPTAAVVSGRVRKSGAEVMRRRMDPLDCLACSTLARDAEYDQILDDDFGIATRGEEIDLTLFPLTPSPYHMPYPYEGLSSPLKALDRTITPAKLRRTESLLPLELSNRVNEKLDQKKRDVKLLRSEVTSLDDKLEKLQGDYDTLGQENRELCFQRDVSSKEVNKLHSQLTDAKAASVGLTEELTRIDAKLSEQALTVKDLHNELALEKSKSQGYKDAMDGLREEVTQFVGSDVEVLFETLGWHLEEIHVTWAHLEKKRTRLRTYTKIHQEVLFSERGDGVRSTKRHRHDLSGDGVWILAMTSQRLRKPAFVYIAVDISRETRLRRKDTIG
ncbi:hypothetical protein Tco_0275830 [Tanacetum coccineum]